MAPSSTSRSFFATFAVVLISIAALFGIDTFLAQTERFESRIEAARLFEQGRNLMRQGHGVDAIDPLKGALAIERTNRDYQLALAEAQLAAGQDADAEAT